VLTFCSLYSANEMIKLAIMHWSLEAYRATRQPLAQRGKQQKSLADSHPAGRILLISQPASRIRTIDIRGPRYLLLLAQSPSEPSASASDLGNTARLVIANPSSPASKSIDRLFSWLPLETTREQVMTGGGARSSSCWTAGSVSSAKGVSISEIWNVSFKLTC
jgi:hypothetical protein